VLAFAGPLLARVADALGRWAARRSEARDEPPAPDVEAAADG
jgi:hypothetical protein